MEDHPRQSTQLSSTSNKNGYLEVDQNQEIQPESYEKQKDHISGINILLSLIVLFVLYVYIRLLVLSQISIFIASGNDPINDLGNTFNVLLILPFALLLYKKTLSPVALFGLMILGGIFLSVFFH